MLAVPLPEAEIGAAARPSGLSLAAVNGPARLRGRRAREAVAALERRARPAQGHRLPPPAHHPRLPLAR